MKLKELRKLIRENIAKELEKTRGGSKYSHLKGLINQVIEEMEDFKTFPNPDYDFTQDIQYLEEIIADLTNIDIEGSEESEGRDLFNQMGIKKDWDLDDLNV